MKNKQEKKESTISGRLTQIPIFQYNAVVEAHKNTLDLLEIMQRDIKKLELELDTAHKEINELKVKLKYR